jgi:tRNA U34 5-carboxymethylaminomethyl modifying GTPase MnmE/TrmE
MSFLEMKGLMTDDGTGFREDLDSIDCSWMKKKGVLLLAAKADLASHVPGTRTGTQYANVQECLQSIVEKLRAFMKSDELRNRTKLMETLKRSLRHAGEVLLLSGPRNVGKSCLLQKFAKEMKTQANVYPVYIDMRSGSFADALQASAKPPGVKDLHSNHVYSFLKNVSNRLATGELENEVLQLASDLCELLHMEAMS